MNDGECSANAYRYDFESNRYRVVAEGRIESSSGSPFFRGMTPGAQLRPGDRIAPLSAFSDLGQGGLFTGLMDNAGGVAALAVAAPVLAEAGVEAMLAFPDEEEGPVGAGNQTMCRGSARIANLLPPPKLAIIADVQQGGGGPDADTRGGVENSTRLGGGAVLSEFSSLARGAVTAFGLYGTARHMADVIAGFGVRVQELNNAYSSRSDDVSVMMRTPNVLLLGYPGFNRHFDQGLPRAHLDDVMKSAKAVVYASVLGPIFEHRRAAMIWDFMMIDIATVGWLTMDDIVLLDHSCRSGVLGGGALYSAIGAQVWSDRVGIHSVTGREIYEDVQARIASRGLDGEGVGAIDGAGLQLWLLHETETFKRQVPKLNSATADDMDRGRGPLPETYRGARGFHVAPQSPAGTAANVRTLSRLPHRPPVTADILSDEYIDRRLYADFAFVRGASAFLPSEQEIMRIWGPADIRLWLRETTLRLKCHMVAKLGERGSLVCDAESGVLIHTPSHPVQVIDTTGAGDGYCGGFVAGLAASRTLTECAAMGAVSASYVIEACGALETEPPTTAARETRLQRVLAETRYENP